MSASQVTPAVSLAEGTSVFTKGCFETCVRNENIPQPGTRRFSGWMEPCSFTVQGCCFLSPSIISALSPPKDDRIDGQLHPICSTSRLVTRSDRTLTRNTLESVSTCHTTARSPIGFWCFALGKSHPASSRNLHDMVPSKFRTHSNGPQSL